MSVIRHPKDFWAGLMFIAVGAAAVALSFDYNLGTAARMGPAYFPRILGAILIVLGVILSLRALRLQGGPVGRYAWRPIVLILGSVVLFGMIVQTIGLVLATFMLIVISTWGGREFHWKEVLIASAVLAAVAVGIFVTGLGLPFPIWPAFIGAR